MASDLDWLVGCLPSEESFPNSSEMDLVGILSVLHAPLPKSAFHRLVPGDISLLETIVDDLDLDESAIILPEPSKSYLLNLVTHSYPDFEFDLLTYHQLVLQYIVENLSESMLPAFPYHMDILMDYSTLPTVCEFIFSLPSALPILPHIPSIVLFLIRRAHYKEAKYLLSLSRIYADEEFELGYCQALYHIMCSQFDRAASQVEACILLAGKDTLRKVKVLLLRIRLLVTIGELVKAEGTLSEGISLAEVLPTSHEDLRAELKYFQAVLYYMNGCYGEAFDIVLPLAVPDSLDHSQAFELKMLKEKARFRMGTKHTGGGDRLLAEIDQFYGKLHPLYIKALFMKCVSLQRAYKYDEALLVVQEALSLVWRVFPGNHILASRGYAEMGSIYKKKEDLQNTILFTQKCYELRRSLLGDENPLTIQAYCRIGEMYRQSGQYELCGKVLQEGLENAMLVDMPQCILSDVHDFFGRYYIDTGDHEKAISHAEIALKIRQSLYSYSHSSIALSYNNLGSAYECAGRYEEALKAHIQAKEIRTAVFGPDGPMVADSLYGIAAVYDELKDFEKSLQYYRQALEIDTKYYGPEHYRISDIYNNMSVVLGKMGQSAEAIKYLDKSFTITSKTRGEEHPDVADYYYNKGREESKLGMGDEAIKHLQTALKIRLKVYGPDNKFVFHCYDCLGSSHYSMKQFREALRYYRKSYKGHCEYYPQDIQYCASVLTRLGLVYERLGQYSTSIKHHEQALELKRLHFPSKLSSIAESYNHLGMTYDEMGNYNEAIEYYQQALKIDTELYGPDHAKQSYVLNNIAVAYEKLGDYKLALQYFRASLRIDSANFDADHIYVRDSEENVQRMLALCDAHGI